MSGLAGLELALERQHVDRLVQAMFADLEVAEHHGREGRLTELGGALAIAASAMIDDEPPG